MDIHFFQRHPCATLSGGSVLWCSVNSFLRQLNLSRLGLSKRVDKVIELLLPFLPRNLVQEGRKEGLCLGCSVRTDMSSHCFSSYKNCCTSHRSHGQLGEKHDTCGLWEHNPCRTTYTRKCRAQLGRRPSQCQGIKITSIRSPYPCNPFIFSAKCVTSNPDNLRSQQSLNRSQHNLGRTRSKPAPIIYKVSNHAVPALLPYSGTGAQIWDQLGRGPATWLRRFVVSMAGSVLLYNVNTFLTILAALYWAWCPIFGAAKSNTLLRLRYKHVGLWRARVLEARLVDSDTGQKRMLKVKVGDRSGTTIEVAVEVPVSKMVVRRGDLAELIVLSDSATFARFRVVREMYLPLQRVWLAEPQECNLEHSIFEQISAEMAALISGAELFEEEVEENWEGRNNLLAESHAHHTASMEGVGMGVEEGAAGRSADFGGLGAEDWRGGGEGSEGGDGYYGGEGLSGDGGGGGDTTMSGWSDVQDGEYKGMKLGD